MQKNLGTASDSFSKLQENLPHLKQVLAKMEAERSQDAGAALQQLKDGKVQAAKEAALEEAEAEQLQPLPVPVFVK